MMKYREFKLHEIQPEGWLLDQLKIQAKGLSGNLDHMWPDIKDSAWIGGDKDSWERVPYWLDGFLPLAHLLRDEDMIARAHFYINSILDRQCEDGWICPIASEKSSQYDPWALFLIGKVLALYCEITDDKRAEDSLYRAMKCLHNKMKIGMINMDKNWGTFRWFECLIPLLHLKETCNEEWIPETAKMLRDAGADYPSYMDRWIDPINDWTLETHIVNLAMMYKYEELYCALVGEKAENMAEKLWRHLYKYNGTAVGLIAGDECLAGIRNNRGTELCSVAELMYSFEWLYRITGKQIWADGLERIALNALPATISDDMWTHQYLQIPNQIACIKFPHKAIFGTNNGESHLFGLEPGYGCCTANFNQAWPKLAMNVFLRAEDGILCSQILPASLNTKINNANVKLSVATEYPFRMTSTYTVTCDQAVTFALHIRVPGWCHEFRVNGKTVKAGSIYTIKRQFEGSTVITVEWLDTPHFISRPYALKAVEYGPLVYALPIETEYKMLEFTRDGVERKFPYCDYELIPKSEWQYGFASDSFEVVEKEGDKYPYSSKNPRIALRTKMSRINWGYDYGYTTVSAYKPNSRTAIGDAEEIELFPYGSTRLRMTEMPIVKQK